jgi:hypothetical protein
MFVGGHYFEILKPVIELVTVLVMYILVRIQLSA